MAKWIDRALNEKRKRIITHSCPAGHFQNGPDVNTENMIVTSKDQLIGCNGITCEQCWNQESGEK